MRKICDSTITGGVPDEQSSWAEWRVTGLILCITSLCVVGLFWETVRSMIQAWAGSRTFAHGSLVLPVWVISSGAIGTCGCSWSRPRLCGGWVLLFSAG